MISNTRCASIVVCALALAVAADAQWSNDPAKNLPIATRGGEQNQPKIRATSDGGCYVSWFDNCFGGFDLYLQSLDVRGLRQWPGNGLLVAKRCVNWIDNYGFCIDDADNAVLAFRDEAGGAELIRVAKVDPSAALPWGPEGVVVWAGAAGALFARVTTTSDGDYVVAWANAVGRGEQLVLRLQRLDANGNTLWGPGLTLADPDGGGYLPCEVEASDDGSVIVSWVRQGPLNTCEPSHLWAQKFSADGTPQWRADHIVVFDGGTLPFGEFPSLVPDGAGGAVFAWRFIASNASDCAVQRIMADGSEWLPHNGLTPSVMARQRYEPSATFNTATQDILVFWEEQLNGPPGVSFAVYGQKIRPDRGREWTSSGRVITPSASTRHGPIRSLPSGDGAMVFFADTPNAEIGLYGGRLGTKGDFVWDPHLLLTCTAYAYRLDAGLSNHGTALLAWVDGRFGDMDIVAQSVQPDGALGPGPVAPGALINTEAD